MGPKNIVKQFHELTNVYSSIEKKLETTILSYFTVNLNKNYFVSVKETLWDVYDREQSTIIEDASSSNAFEEMIQWTKQGKMWTFPIDNEQG
jgi:hypothetical protein